jgi:hypothetical protein
LIFSPLFLSLYIFLFNTFIWLWITKIPHSYYFWKMSKKNTTFLFLFTLNYSWKLTLSSSSLLFTGFSLFSSFTFPSHPKNLSESEWKGGMEAPWPPVECPLWYPHMLPHSPGIPLSVHRGQGQSSQAAVTQPHQLSVGYSPSSMLWFPGVGERETNVDPSQPPPAQPSTHTARVEGASIVVAP